MGGHVQGDRGSRCPRKNRASRQGQPSSATAHPQAGRCIGLRVVLVDRAGTGVRDRLQEARGQHQRRLDRRRARRRPPREPSRSKGPKKPLNVLVMGSDNRDGTNIGGDTPGLSDTTILLHLSADRKRAYGVSIPRDAMVERPECQTKNGKKTVPGGADPVQRGVRRRRAGLHHQDRREDHRRPHRPLRGDRLQRLQGHGQRRQRGHGLRARGGQRRHRRHPPARRAPTRSTATRRSTTCGCATGSAPRPATSAG